MRTSTICKGTKHLTMEEIVQKAALIHERMSGNPNFPDAGPLLAVLDARRRAMEVANDRCLFFGGRIATVPASPASRWCDLPGPPVPPSPIGPLPGG